MRLGWGGEYRMTGSIAAVIPVHNREQLIGRALESVFGQRHPPDEIIVVDDGSTDRTADVARAYGSRIRVIEAAHGGAGAARNLGVEAATSDFVAFLDSDDFWEPEHLARMSEAIRATDGRAVMYFSDCRLDDWHGGGTIWSLANFDPAEPFEFRDSEKDWLFAPLQPLLIQSAAVRRNAYLAVGGSDPALPRRGDTHLIFKLGLSGPLCAVPGIASTWTADAQNSLTRQLVSEHPTYLRCTVHLYADLLERFTLTPEQRKILSLRAADAHYALARQTWRSHPLEMLAHLSKAVRTNPHGLWERARRRLSGPPAPSGPGSTRGEHTGVTTPTQ